MSSSRPWADLDPWRVVGPVGNPYVGIGAVDDTGADSEAPWAF